MKAVKRILLRMFVVLIITAVVTTCMIFPVNSESDTKQNSSTQLITNVSYCYSDYISDMTNRGFSNYEGKELVFSADKVDESNQIATVDGMCVAVSDEEHPMSTFNIEIETPGLYQISCKYKFNEATGYNGKRKLMIDGNSICMEADNIAFYRRFKDASKPTVNSVGDEVRASAKEILDWQENKLYDSLGRYSKPLSFAFSKGEHKLSFQYDSQKLSIAYIVLSAPDSNVSYSRYLSGKKSSLKNFTEKFQAETSMSSRNDSAIGVASDGDPKVYPSKPGYLVMNTVGGYSFRSGGQSITFSVNVPKTDYYAVNFRCLQNWNNNMNSYRKVEINGSVPFEEMECVPFGYSSKWKNEILGGKDNPYLFYLKKGKNDITISVQLGPNTETIRMLENSLEALSILSREITMIIGNNPDVNYDYELDRVIPKLKSRLKQIADLLNKAKKRCNEQNNGNRTVVGNALDTNINLLTEFKNDPAQIPRRINELNNIITSVGTSITSLQEQPLQIDYLEIFSPDVEIKNFNSNFFDRMAATLKGFVVSFSKDYNSISISDSSSNKVIDVWVGRGKEWAQIMKELTDSAFIPDSGISVNFNVVPSGALASSGSANLLLLAISSGKQPDLAMGITSGMPVEYAMRNVAVDFTKFDDYTEFIKNFPNGIMIPFEYKGGIYGIPETMTFNGMFYRTDIFKQLGLSVPKTWDEVFINLLPILNENGMQFCLPISLSTFLLSNNGSYYRKKDNGRFECALDTDEAFEAFQMMTDAYLLYGIPTAANFFNRFRTGEMPIGISGEGLYLSIIASAPELSGKWAVAPIPGIENDEGKIVYKYSGLTSTALTALSASTKQNETWEFIKWWMSDETQTVYAREVESRIGISARWASANMKAFLSLPWEKTVTRTVKDMWNNISEVPNVPGGYFTARHVSNAWNRVVLNGMMPRESLEKTIIDINKELDRKASQIEAKNK